MRQSDVEWPAPQSAPTTPELSSFDHWEEFLEDRPGLASDPLTANFFDDYTSTDSAVPASGDEWTTFASWTDHHDG